MKQFDSFRLDASNGCLWRGTVQIDLPPKPFAVLCYLVDNPGRLITHDELLDALWPDTFVQPQVLRTYMLELRKVLGDDAGQPRFIQTLPKRGYRFVAPVTGTGDPNSTFTSVRETDPTPVAPSALVGRDGELARLHREAQRAFAGERRAVFITGEAGIGKTALAAGFCQQLQGSQAILQARGQCIQGIGSTEEYYPVMEALGQLCASPDGDRVCSVLARMAPAWLARLGRSHEICDVPASSTQERKLGDLCRALEELASASPVCLFFEDLHWADESTINLIAALVRRQTPAKLLLLATCRPRGAGNCAERLSHDLRVRKLCAEVALSPLAAAGVDALLAHELRQPDLPAGLGEFVYRQSEGNPLFVIAILEHLLAKGFLVRAAAESEAGWRLSAAQPLSEAGVPTELAQLVELEIESLSPADQRVLEAASLMQVAFPAWAVAAALQMDVAEAEEACDRLARQVYFVERAGQDELPDGTFSAFYAFVHGLYREVLYLRQAPARRAQRHIRVAEQLDRLFAGHSSDVGREIAQHYEAAGSWQGASAALHAAAYQAQQRQAFAEAADLLEHAVRIVERLAGDEHHAVSAGLRNELEQVRAAIPAVS